MKSFYILAFILTSTSITIAQQISGPQLLDKAIQYHDPQGHWSTFNDTLNITMTMPESNTRTSQIVINLPKEYFSVTAQKDTVTTQYTIIKDSCTISLNGNKKLTNKQLKSNNQPLLGTARPYQDYILWYEQQPKNKALDFWSNYLSDYEDIATLPEHYFVTVLEA